MAGQVAQHGAQTDAARAKNNAKAKNNHIREREFQVTANLDNVQYINDVIDQDQDQDSTYAAMLDQWSDTDYQLKNIFATQDFAIEDAIIAMHQGGASEQTGASAARASIGKDVLALGKAKTRAIHSKMMAVDEANRAKQKTWRGGKNDSEALFREVAFAPTHGFNPTPDENWEKGPSKAGLVLGLADTGWKGYQDFKANTAPKVT